MAYPANQFTHKMSSYNHSSLGMIISDRSWDNFIVYPSGKPHQTAIKLLSEILYWYKPFTKPLKNGRSILQKKFKGTWLYVSYKELSKKLKIKRAKTIQEGFRYLEKIGILKRHIEKEEYKGNIVSVVYIELFVDHLIQLQKEAETYTPPVLKVIENPNIGNVDFSEFDDSYVPDLKIINCVQMDVDRPPPPPSNDQYSKTSSETSSFIRINEEKAVESGSHSYVGNSSNQAHSEPKPIINSLDNYQTSEDSLIFSKKNLSLIPDPTQYIPNLNRIDPEMPDWVKKPLDIINYNYLNTLNLDSDKKTLSHYACNCTLEKLQITAMHLKNIESKTTVRSRGAIYRKELRKNHDGTIKYADLNRQFAIEFKRKNNWHSLQIKNDYVIDSGKDLPLAMIPSEFEAILEHIFEIHKE